MNRVANSVITRKRRKKILGSTSFFSVGKKRFKTAKIRLYHAMQSSTQDRKRKPRLFREIWINRLNAAVRKVGLSYSQFMDKLNKSNININRKNLVILLNHEPMAFNALVNL